MNVQSCTKNCNPAARRSNGFERTVLVANCLKYCDGITDSSYYWTVDDSWFNYDNAENGRVTKFFSIAPGGLHIFTTLLAVYKQFYRITVTLISMKKLI